MNLDEIFILKENANPNYLATICKIEDVFPIEGADKLMKTVVNGYDIVIPKTFETGNIVVYFPVESAICEKYLSANNLYEFSEANKNSNFENVKKLVDDADYLIHPYREGIHTDEDKEKYDSLIAEAKSMCGFFNKYGRVRIIKLRGQYSQGFIADINSMIKYNPELNGIDWEKLIGKQFNYIGDEEFCWKYIPIKNKCKDNETNSKDRQWKKRTKKLKKFNRIIDNQFAFHYDRICVA